MLDLLNSCVCYKTLSLNTLDTYYLSARRVWLPLVLSLFIISVHLIIYRTLLCPTYYTPLYWWCVTPPVAHYLHLPSSISSVLSPFPKPHRTTKNHYILSSKSPSKQAYNILLHRAYNLQGINTLQTAFENMPFLPQEGPPLAPRRACSQTEKGMFCHVKEYILRTWGAKKVDKGRGG